MGRMRWHAPRILEALMATDLTVFLDDEPGELARLGQVLGDAGVNIEGFCTTTSAGGQVEVHVLVEDAAAAFSSLAAAGIEVGSEEEVAVVAVEDRPGELGRVSQKLGDAGVNVTLAYLATNTRLVFAADDLARAQAALE
jgi:hypothetical protein